MDNENEYNNPDEKYSLEFWHEPDLAPSKDEPFAFVMRSKSGGEMGIWLNHKDIEGYVRAMQRALAGETHLSDGVH